LATHAKGTAQKMISKDALENLEVFLPQLEQQRKILEVATLAEQEQSIMKKLTDKRKRYISVKLIEMAQGESNR
jgi:restriction endonuclease S subunit